MYVGFLLLGHVTGFILCLILIQFPRFLSGVSDSWGFIEWFYLSTSYMNIIKLISRILQFHKFVSVTAPRQYD